MVPASLSSESVRSWLERVRAARIVVIGDVILDEYELGSVTRTSPEAPVPVVDVRERWSSLGGAANVARQLVLLGAEVTLVGVVGSDTAGDTVRAHCHAIGLPSTHLVVDRTRPTTTKRRVLADGRQVLRVDREDDRAVGPPVEARLCAALEGLGEVDAVVVSDYAKGVLTDVVLAQLHRLVPAGAPLMVDPKRTDLSAYRGATIVKANAVEFAAIAGRRLEPDPVAATMQLAPSVRRDHGLTVLVVTLGAEGMVVVDEQGARHVAARPTEVFDVSGAGDTVAAVLALGAVARAPIDDAAALAAHAARLVVQRAGVSCVGIADLVGGAAPRRRPAPVLDADQVAVVARAWRDQGCRVVFTNGCFDLFHDGHLALLSHASRRGDVMVVAVNDDASVRELKGPSRPIIGVYDRCSIVAGVAGVDAVVAFSGHDLLELLEAVRPDVLVKGADYRLDHVVGADLVATWGGTTHLVPLLEGVSTTSQLARRSSATAQAAEGAGGG